MNLALPFSSAADRAATQHFFADRPLAQSLFEGLVAHMATMGPMTLTATKSRVAFVRTTRFLWVHEATREGIWLGFLLPRQVKSPRLRSGAKGKHWSHHVKVTAPLDPELLGWLREAHAADVKAPRAH